MDAAPTGVIPFEWWEELTWQVGREPLFRSDRRKSNVSRNRK
jgi:hypothetical protein